MFDKEIKKIANIITGYNRFLVTSTADPDGDSVGSQLALSSILKRQIKETRNKRTIEIVNEIHCPERYTFLPNSDEILTLDDIKTDIFDVGFVLDGGSERTGKIKDLFDKCAVKIIIDHHKFGSKAVYDVELRSQHISSTAEIVYQFIESDAWHVSLNKDIAAQLYLGIIFDTGFLRHSNTSPQTLLTVSKFIETGIDFSDIAEKGMLQKEFKAQKLLARVMEAAQISPDGKIVWSTVTEEMIKDTGSSREDQEGLIEQLVLIKGAEVAVLFKEDKKDTYKLSFRSKGGIDVGKLARSLDNDGGGHERAAGCMLKDSLDSIIKNVIENIRLRLA